MRIERSFDVVVIGTGISGLATAYHLQRLGIQRLAIAGPNLEASATSRSAGLISGGQVDNFTRIAQAHTAERATALWRFGDAAFDALVAYLQRGGVKHLKNRRLRLLTSPSEQREAALAVAQMTANGLSAQLIATKSTDPDGLLESLQSRILGVQSDGGRGGWVDPKALLNKLQSDTATLPRLNVVQAIDDAGGAPLLRLMDGSTISCEIVVAAAHLQIRSLLPDLAPALVSFADQWLHLSLKHLPKDALGTAFSANNTHEWGVFSSPNRLRLGGARYLRPMAGIEATTPSVEPKVTAQLLATLGEMFSFAEGAKILTSHASLDINPCDELPLIGPSFGSSRILVATGFMGTGLTTGFWAGKCLADLVAYGKAPDLPRFLWPERLRTLSSS